MIFWTVEQNAEILQESSDEEIKKVSQLVAGACMHGPVLLSCVLPLWRSVWGSRSQGQAVFSLVITVSKQFAWTFV